MSKNLKADYQICEEIGSGRFGTVYRCFSPATGESYTCKSIDKSLLLDSTDRDCLEKEPKILGLLGAHPDILHLFKTYDDDNYFHLISDLCPTGDDLFSRVSRGPLSEPEAAAVLRQLMSAVSYCHHMGIAHRDIKPDHPHSTLIWTINSVGLVLSVCYPGAFVWYVPKEMRYKAGIVFAADAHIMAAIATPVLILVDTKKERTLIVGIIYYVRLADDC